MTRDEARSAIRSAGLRATHQRVALLGVLGDVGEPMSHGQISARLANARERSTVYRNLAALARVGLVRRIQFGDRVWRFQHAAQQRIPQFICARCGEVTCLPSLHLLADRVRSPRAVRCGEVDVQLRGLCDRCAP